MDVESELESKPIVGEWVRFVDLPRPRESLAVVSLGKQLIGVGGWNSESRALDEVIGIGVATPATKWVIHAAFPRAVQHHAGISYGQRLLVIGGDDGFGGSTSDAIMLATTNGAGRCSKWSEVGRLRQARTLHACALAGHRAYVLGGARTFDRGTELSVDVERIDILSDAEISVAPMRDLPAPFGWGAAVATESRIYILGGLSEFATQTATSHVWSAAIDDRGELAEWRREADLPTPRYRLAAVARSDAVLVVGGLSPDGPLDEVLIGRPGAEGRIASWEIQRALPEPRFAHACIISGDHVYVAGGFARPNSGFETENSVFRAAID